jgi:hypothetical protein
VKIQKAAVYVRALIRAREWGGLVESWGNDTIDVINAFEVDSR